MFSFAICARVESDVWLKRLCSFHTLKETSCVISFFLLLDVRSMTLIFDDMLATLGICPHDPLIALFVAVSGMSFCCATQVGM